MTAWAWGLPVLTPRTPRLLSPLPQPPRCLQSASSQLPQALVQGTPNQVNSAWTQSRDENGSPRTGQNRMALPVGVVVGGAVPQAACRTRGRAGAVQLVGPGPPGSCLLPSGLTSILSGPIYKHRQALPWAESAAWPALRARAGRVAQQLSRDQPTPGPALSSQAQRRMAPSPSVRGASGGREGPCAD